jgi:3-oxoacyl-[acyl-carrier protein] reductase
MIAIDLTGKTALVTGATGQLGRVMVRTLAEAGADVAIHYHGHAAKAHELAETLQGMGRKTLAVQGDVTRKTDVERMRETVLGGLRPPDIIVNNAVIQYDWKPVLEQDETDYESQFRSCVMQNVHMVKTFVPDMIASGWGRVIGINTECTMQCWPNQSAYVSGKGGMNRLLRTLAREIGGHHITVNEVAPGWTISEDRPAEGTPDWYLNGVALKRRGTDREIANVVAFLASDLARFITGAYIPVCGGNVMPAL